MKRRVYHHFVSLLLAALFLTSAHAQENGPPASLPQHSGHLNDFAGVIEAGAKERLENILANLKQRGGIEFSVAIIKTTEGQKMSVYSLQLAREWKIGTMQNRDKSLLLVISTENGEFLTQISRGFRSEMPDGLIGDMGNRMRDQIAKGNYSEALLTALQVFVTQMAEKSGFSAEGMDQPPAQAATAETTQSVPPTTDTIPKEAEAAPTPAPSTEAAPTEAKTTEAATKEPEPKPTPARRRPLRDAFTKETAKKGATTADEDPDKAELDAIVQTSSTSERAEKLPPAERVEKLKAFLEAHPNSKLKPVATELLVSAYAALGDEKLQAGDADGGVAQFDAALKQTPDKMSDALFAQVVSQIPANLYLRGQRSTSVDAAHIIEAKVKDDPKRLLALAGFFLKIENADEAARLAETVIGQAPEMAAAHQALGAARHIALRLDEAGTEYARALELDPKLQEARQGLADLKRASGKSEDALNLYREQLAADAANQGEADSAAQSEIEKARQSEIKRARRDRARAGLVLSLLDLGKREEAEQEMDAALKENEKNLQLLVGASYWYAAHNEAARAQELAAKAIATEPRYTWAHIALARSLVAQKHPLDAERVLRFARTYGRFPTLDYELASALAASGLYEEAAVELARSFTIKEGQIETRLAGRVPARNASFIELLAPERRAGIFQSTAADTEANARMLKGLLEFTLALGTAGGKGEVDSALLASAQQDFLGDEDPMRTFRQLYAASRMLRRGAELPKVAEIAEASAGGVEAALDSPVATVSVMADELSDARSLAINSGQVLSLPEIQRGILANILRGRIEDLIAWSLFNQGKADDAVTHLKRALSVLPEGSPWWRTAQWHMGTALEATGNQRDALGAYLKSYNPAQPDPVRRAIIETLYRKVNGSLNGLNAIIGPA